MPLSLLSYMTAIRPGLPVSFLGVGGTPPYLYSVSNVNDFAGGTINFTSGVYTAPADLPETPRKQYDTIIVTDSLSNTASKKIMVASPILLLCDILQNELELDSDHVYIWNQKLKEPEDYKMYIALSNPYSIPFANNRKFDPDINSTIQSINQTDIIDLNIISRGPAARDKKQRVLMALNSQYAEQQKNINSINIGQLPYSRQFKDLSGIDGAAIPYRYQISIALGYSETYVKNVDYYDNFDKTLLVNP